jgi:hypothetical protein
VASLALALGHTEDNNLRALAAPLGVAYAMAFQLRHGLMVCGAALGIVAACGGSDGAKTVANASSFEQGCDQGAEALCSRMFDCMKALYTLSYGTVANCKATVATSCNRSYTAAGQGWQPADLSACANSYYSLSCGDILSSDGSSIGDCREHPGAFVDGADCILSSQCQSLYCKNANATAGTCGTCVARVAEGAACDETSMCQAGQLCVQTAAGSATYSCAKRQPLGANCDTSHPCAQRTTCLNGTCSSLVGLGGACDATTGGGECDYYEALRCNSTTGRCEAMTNASLGESCGMFDGSYKTCAYGSSCLASSTGAASLCVAKAATGQACSDTVGPRCNDYDDCVNGICTAIDYTVCQ